MKQLLLLVIAFLNLIGCRSPEKKMFNKRPNILWIMIEDWGYNLSCYGAKGVSTPNIDRLALQGIRFTHSFCTAPVSSPSRSAMMTGFHQEYIGAGQHRTEGPGFIRKELPNGIKPIPHLLEGAGYYTCLIDKKTDCNFTTEKPLFMGKDWTERKEGQPFFAQVSFQGTHRTWHRDTINPVNINEVIVPPYYPDVPFTRRDIATGMEAVQNVDREVGKLLRRLDDEGLTNNTLVFFIGDNGYCMPRGKQFLYDEGISVPMIVRWPGNIPPKQVSDNMVMTIDICATILDAAGVDPGYKLHGKNLFGKEVAERKYIFAARDKMDWTFDAMRAIRSKEFKLIQNLMPERPYCQFNRYKEASYPVLALLNMMNLKGDLNPDQAKFMAAKKPDIEFYDMIKDPYELKNLADDPKYTSVKKELLAKLMEWRESVNDTGVSEEFRKGGWPSVFPTRSVDEWTQIVEKWETWLFSDPHKKSEYPKIDYIEGALAIPVN
jgi:N-sulfoglucosamine sulfohydrolase